MVLGLIDAIWSVLGIYIIIAMYLVAVLVIWTVIFVQKKRPETVMVWVLACLAFPLVFVLLFYAYLGRDYRKKKMFRDKVEADRDVAEALLKLKEGYYSLDPSKSELGPNESLARMLYESNRTFLTNDNEVEYYNDGRFIFEDMLAEIKAAKRFVHMEFYMIRNDALAKDFRAALVQKAKEGVEVKVLMDAAGCHRLPRGFFKELKDAGGKTASSSLRSYP